MLNVFYRTLGNRRFNGSLYGGLRCYAKNIVNRCDKQRFNAVIAYVTAVLMAAFMAVYDVLQRIS